MDGKILLLFLIWIVSALDAQNQTGFVRVESGYDPGECSGANRGQTKMVKDRQDNDKLFVCSHYNNQYTWQRPDGSSTYGEFFNPGFDCTDILNHDPNAQDGYFWINLNEAIAKQVWCDMTTDGGGFMLIAHKTSPVTWTVPSNNTRVDPLSSHQWSSALGNASIMDFRVQVSTSSQFSNTRAHWSLRLSNKRPLKELMILGKGGCDSTSPGIGDVAFVKDLMTERVVTHYFRCSKFGIPHSAGFGWSMMNKCLKQPCKKGFAFFKDIPLQLDYSGAFSYSVYGRTSGINHDATAFVGCDRKHCCACFGPIGGTNNYCTEHCQAINGGTIVKNVNTWFWVRSTLPKRVWRHCMEYQWNRNDGRGLQWFKLMGDDTNPVLGRCPKKEPNLSDGVVVVPDGTTMNKVPHVPGLLAFRKDINRLYIRSNYNWREVAKKYEILPMIQEVKSQLGQVIKQLAGGIRLRGVSSSSRGRVEVLYHGQWGTVCDDDWDINDGHVVCRQLGYSRATAVYHSARYGQGTGEILLDDLRCTGSERWLWECPHSGWLVDNCSHGEDASVDCS